MSIEAVEREIQRLFECKKPRLLCISGKWGVGKTYLWNRLVEKHEPPLKHYSYVSLFGLNSLEDINTKILASTFGDSGNLIEQASKTIRKSLSGNKLAVVPDLLKAVALSQIHNHVICFDDMERAGKSLDALDILGLACKLKEQHDCRIVFLLNADKLEEEDKTEFNRQIERVADRRLSLQPTVEEAADIGLDKSELPAPALDIIRDRLAKLDITNIRTIQQVKSRADCLMSILDKAHADSDRDELLASKTFFGCLSTLTLAVCSFQQPDGKIPSLSFLRSDKLYSYGDETADKKTENYRKFLSDYQYTETGELDKTILDGVERGYFDEPILIDIFQKAVTAELKTSTFRKAWDMYHHALHIDNEDAFLDTLYRGAIEEAQYITVVNINSAIHLLRTMKRDKQAGEVIAAYVEARDEDIADWVERRRERGESIAHIMCRSNGTDIGAIDSKLREALIKRGDEHYAKYIESLDAMTIFRGIVAHDQLNSTDIDLLAHKSVVSVEDFEQLLLQLEGEETDPALKNIQRMWAQLRGHDSQNIERQFVEKIIAALQNIAKRDMLQAEKFKVLGFELE